MLAPCQATLLILLDTSPSGNVWKGQKKPTPSSEIG